MSTFGQVRDVKDRKVVRASKRNLSTPEKRALLRRHWKAFEDWRAERDSYERQHPLESFKKELPEFPHELAGLDCGAKTRAGTPCKRHDISLSNGRCRLHGGHSTGPTSKRGKARSAKNGLLPKRRKRTP